MMGNLNCCTMSAENGACRFLVTDPADPYFAISYRKSEETLSAGVYRYLEITYRAPAENALKEYTTELFLVAGDTKTPTAGKSVTFTFPADGKFHTTVLDLAETTFWSGSIHMVRIDFYSGSKAGDLYEIQSIRLLKTNGA